MKTEEFYNTASDGKKIHVYHWAPNGSVTSVLMVAHGMAEHAARYARLAEFLTEHGIDVWAEDHRGHGKTAQEGELGWLAPKNGFRRVIEDLHELSVFIKEKHPDKPFFLLGHSWGSFLSQGYIALYGNELTGCILSGTAGNGGPIVAVGRMLANLGCIFIGQKKKTPLMDSMSFGSFNKAFQPVRTKFDWLSRDPEEVGKYINDPLCGFVCSFGFFRDLLGGLVWIHSKKTMRSIPATLPVYMFAGSKDPVGAATGSFDKLFNQYQELGIKDLTKKLYPDARHETLNETNREEVMHDLLQWLKAHGA